MSTAYTSSIAARVLTDAGGPAPGRIQLFPAGEFSARDGRPGTLKGVKAKAWTITPIIAAAVIARWQQRETPLVVDYEHQTINAAENGKPAPAAGWIESLEAGADGLYATVKWTDAARAFIQADEYRYISPVFTFDPETGAVLELKSAALTNYPALDGMDAVAARTKDDSSMKKETLEALRQFFGLAADADEDAALAALKAQGQTLAAMLTAAKEAIPDPSKYVPAAILTAAQEKNAALAAKVKELEGNGSLAALTAEIDAALADGRLPKSCEAWAKATAKTHPDAVKSYIASSVPPIAALTSTQTGGTSPAGTPHIAALTDEERYACAQLGMSEAEFLEAKKTEKK
ncbi:phage protease [uncultured Bilophila sp.]|uniref:phage protease n=1 Tax=uncultured Bilophila sp. TaxID=529385 RepID=UPI0026DB5420|nr:phage protease [uncultured Bilophila sp.]